MKPSELKTHSELMSMWQSDLASHISKLFYGGTESFTDHELKLACQVWKERFGHFPTVGELAVFTEKT